MLLKKLIDLHNDHLVIFFAGWSSHWSQFQNLTFDGCDLWVIYNYTSLDLQLPSQKCYSKVVLIGWSFGVWTAALKLDEILSPCLSIAIAGSQIAVDDRFGIPQKAFELTINSIEKVGLSKFNRRMCGKNSEWFTSSSRDENEMVNELKELAVHFKEQQIEFKKWDYALICSEDLIFPEQNLLDFWQDYSNFAPLKICQPHFIFSLEGIEILRELVANRVNQV